MKKKLINKLIKAGMNKEKAILKVDKLFYYVLRVYPNSSLKEKINIICSINVI